MRPVELRREDEAWCFKQSCLFGESKQCVTGRQASETDGLFVFSCLCSSSGAALILTVGAGDVYNACRRTCIAVGKCTTWTRAVGPPPISVSLQQYFFFSAKQMGSLFFLQKILFSVFEHTIDTIISAYLVSDMQRNLCLSCEGSDNASNTSSHTYRTQARPLIRTVTEPPYAVWKQHAFPRLSEPHSIIPPPL